MAVIMRWCVRSFLFIVFFISGTAFAVSPESQLKALAQEPYWLALLHIPTNRAQSEIIAPDFFLAANGARDPYAELVATLEQLQATEADDSNSHAQCRFIARFHWLKQQVPHLLAAAPEIRCPMFDAWTDQQQITSVSAVFASGYLGNPASFYGHILLKLNSSNDSKNILQQQSLNFGAAVPDGENPLVYIIKGLFGGYNAVFSHGLFYKNVHTYGEAELRDLWEYQLKLTPEQVQQLVFHAWELIGRDYQYFFLQENCAYRMAELLELVIGSELISKQQPWAMPITVFQRLAETSQQQHSLIDQVIHHPSRQQRFQQRYDALNEQQRKAVQSIIQSEFSVQHHTYNSLTSVEQSAVLEMLFDYLEFLRINKQALYSQQAKNRMLQARLKLPAAYTVSRKTANMPPPHQATRPSMLQVSAVQADTNAAQLRFRATYYDLLTAATSGAPYSALSMFDLTLRFSDKLRLQRFDLLNIENMNLSITGLPADGGYAWKLNLAYAPQHLACDSCQVLQLNGGIGKAGLWSGDILTYALLDASLHTNRAGSGIASLQPRFGLVADITPWWRMQLEAGRRFPVTSDSNNFSWYRWQHRFGNQPNWDLRFSVTQQKATELTLAYSYYW